MLYYWNLVREVPRKMKKQKKKNKIQDGMMTLLIILMGSSLLLILGVAFLDSRERTSESVSAKSAAEEVKLDSFSEDTNKAIPEDSETEIPTEIIEETEEPVEEAKYDLTGEISIPDVEFPYYVKVNRKMNCVTVYTLDEKNTYSVPVKAMVCSVGLDDNTPLGIFTTSESYQWRQLFGNVYGQYAYRIYNTIMFHSVPYFTPDKDNLETEEYNKLGEAASLGCVRLSVEDAKWLVDHCPSGTTVEIYEDDDPGPLGKPSALKINTKSKNAGWDPTDPDKKNPWKKNQKSEESDKEDTSPYDIGSEIGAGSENDLTPPTIKMPDNLVVDDNNLSELRSYLQRKIIIRDNGKALDATHAVFDIYQMEAMMHSMSYGTYTGKVYAIDDHGNRSKTVEFCVRYQPVSEE